MARWGELRNIGCVSVVARVVSAGGVVRRLALHCRLDERCDQVRRRLAEAVNRRGSDGNEIDAVRLLIAPAERLGRQLGSAVETRTGPIGGGYHGMLVVDRLVLAPGQHTDGREIDDAPHTEQADRFENIHGSREVDSKGKPWRVMHVIDDRSDMNNRLGFGLLYGRGEIGKVVNAAGYEIKPFANGRQQPYGYRTRLPHIQNGDLVAAVGKPPHHVHPDETGAASNQNSHEGTSWMVGPTSIPVFRKIVAFLTRGRAQMPM
jgi:hypothetical protein